MSVTTRVDHVGGRGGDITIEEQGDRGVTKGLLTNSALVYESQCGEMWEGGFSGSQPMSTAVHIT